MKNCWIILLFCPFMLLGQSKHPTKNRKPGRPKVERMAPPATDNVIAPPAMPEYVPPDSILNPVSLADAFRIGRGRGMGLITVILPATRIDKFSATVPGFIDSIDVLQHIQDLAKQGAQSYGPHFVVYRASPSEITQQALPAPLLYPAYYFFAQDGTLMGKKEGARQEIYPLINDAAALLEKAQEKIVKRLHDKYLQHQTDNAETVQLILLTKDWNSKHNDKPLLPDAAAILSEMLSARQTKAPADTSLFSLINTVFVDDGYVKEIADPVLLSFLLQHYSQLHYDKFVWYDAISSTIDNGYAKLGNQDSVLTKASRRIIADSLRNLQAVFAGKLRNIQVLTQGISLVQKYHDLLKEDPSPASLQAALSVSRWFFDTLLLANRGLAGIEQQLKKVEGGLSASEKEFLADRWVDFPGFSRNCKRDGAMLLNNISWELFKADLRNEWLPELLGWSKTSLEIEPNNPFYLDTHAHLAYMNGEKVLAIAQQQKAIEQLQKSSTFADAKWMLPQMRKVLVDMKSGAKPMRDEYAEPSR